jgi:hypothetical protein
MIWDTRSSSGTPVATLGVRAGEQRTTHTGEQTHTQLLPLPYPVCLQTPTASPAWDTCAVPHS